MNRLQTEFLRLYLSHDPAKVAGPDLELVDANGQSRAMVMEVAQQVGWGAVAALWQGVQSELELPAPAIAVSGIDGYQVWFSLLEPIPVVQAQDFLESLRLRYLGTVAPRFIGMKPNADGSPPWPTHHSRPVPAVQAETGHWSAFVVPGLASMFEEEPWLDLPPNSDAQANILSRLESIQPAHFQVARDRLRPINTQVILDPQSAPAATSAADNKLASAGQALTHDGADPKRFLLAVMNDSSAELALRIEAAKALLPFFEEK